MPDESPNTFDDIKPFLRMLEGSIDQARAKRLSREGHPPVEKPADRPGVPHATNDPIPLNTDSTASIPENDTTDNSSALPKARKIPFGKRTTSMSTDVNHADHHPGPVATPRYRLP